MIQPSPFSASEEISPQSDAERETQAKTLGKERSAERRSASVRQAQVAARFVAMKRKVEGSDPVLTVDDVRHYMETHDMPYQPGNWMGSIFRGTEWTWTGRVMPSTHKGAHGREVRIWRWTP